MTDWEKCAAFHGHECGGLTIGYQAARYAIKLLDLKFSADEQVVCIAETDGCSVDGLQVMLGCSVGKGNMLFHITGKQAFSIYDRTSGKSVRLVLRNNTVDRKDSFEYYQNCRPEDMFDVKPTTIALPERARMFGSYVCDCCGETAGANWIRLAGDKKLCLDCYGHYDRFKV